MTAEGGGAPVGSFPIVVADDDDLSRELVVRYLDKLNLQNPVLTAADGDQVVALLTAAGTVPALVLLDLDMPGRNGLDLLAWIRSEMGDEVPVVMLTGSAQLDDVDSAFALGIASYLVKPVGFAALSDVLRQLRLPWQLLPSARSLVT